MFEKIQKELAEYFEIAPETITRDTSFADDLKADSLALMELMFALESETGVTLPDDIMENVKTVGDLCKVLEKN
ncbi:MAG: acyl carrier protein [Clostridia bacterium]|nr:acyl carrier protein [Clostridia bacterium]